MLRVHVVGGNIFEGSTFAIDPVTKCIIIKNEADGSFHLINSKKITQIEGDLSTIQPPDLISLGISNLNDAERREYNFKETTEKNIRALNPTVSEDVQDLFDRFRSIYPCTWGPNHEIIVLEEFIIAPPYETVQVLSPGRNQSDGYHRVRRMLEGERKKLKLSS